jgi:hypothetical protein
MRGQTRKQAQRFKREKNEKNSRKKIKKTSKRDGNRKISFENDG